MDRNIRLAGWKAMPAIVVVVCIVTFQLLTKRRSLQTEAVEKIKVELAASYARHLLPELDKAVQNPGTVGEQVTRIAAQLSSDNIEIVSIGARGRGRGVVARVEIQVDGQDPPDGRRVRYFKLSYSTVTGWMVRREVSKWSYYLSI